VSSGTPGYDFWFEPGGGEFLRTCYAEAPPAFRRSFEAEEAFVRENLPESGRVLEVGCGTGRFLAKIAGGGRETFGCDLSRTALAAARASLAPVIRLAAADAAALPYRSGAFDAVLCVQASLGNFGDRKEGALREMRRALRAGGVLLLAVYTDAALEERLGWYRRLEGSPIFGRVDPARSRDQLVVTTTGWVSEGFSRGEIEGLVRGAGFTPRFDARDPLLHLVEGR